MKQRTVRWVGLALFGTVLLAGAGACGPSATTRADAPTRQADRRPYAVAIAPVEALEGPYDVIRVVDGDTIHVRIGAADVKVRFIGIDTPETVAPGRPVGCFGPEASAEAHRLMDGRSVYLEYDATQGRLDKYDRTLAYVWLSPTVSVNEALVRGGFAEEYTYSSAYHHRDAFLAAQDAAIASGAGMWSACQ